MDDAVEKKTTEWSSIHDLGQLFKFLASFPKSILFNFYVNEAVLDATTTIHIRNRLPAHQRPVIASNSSGFEKLHSLKFLETWSIKAEQCEKFDFGIRQDYIMFGFPWYLLISYHLGNMKRREITPSP